MPAMEERPLARQQQPERLWARTEVLECTSTELAGAWGPGPIIHTHRQAALAVRWLGRLTNGRHPDVQRDESLSLTVDDDTHRGNRVSCGWLSASVQNQVYFATPLALMEPAVPGELAAPLFLGDSFVKFDTASDLCTPAAGIAQGRQVLLSSYSRIPIMVLRY